MPLFLGRRVTCPELGVGYITFEEEDSTANTARLLEATFPESCLHGCAEVLADLWKVKLEFNAPALNLPAYRCQVKFGHHAPIGLGLDPEMARQVLAERKRMVA